MGWSLLAVAISALGTLSSAHAYEIAADTSIPIGDISSFQMTLLDEKIFTPGVKDAQLRIDLDGTFAAPQLIIERGSEVAGCDGGFSGVIGLALTQTSIETSASWSVTFSGTRTDPPQSGQSVKYTISGSDVAASIPLGVTREFYSLCIEDDPQTEPSPTVTPSPQASAPAPEVTESPTVSPQPSPTVSPQPSPIKTPGAGAQPSRQAPPPPGPQGRATPHPGGPNPPPPSQSDHAAGS